MFMLFISSLGCSNPTKISKSQFVCSQPALKTTSRCHQSSVSIAMLGQPGHDINREGTWKDVDDLLSDVSEKISSIPPASNAAHIRDNDIESEKEFERRFAQAELNNGVQRSHVQQNEDDDEMNKSEITTNALLSETFSVEDDSINNSVDQTFEEKYLISSPSSNNNNDSTITTNNIGDDEEQLQQYEQRHQSNPRLSNITRMKEAKDMISRRQAKLQLEHHGHQYVTHFTDDEKVTQAFLPDEKAQVYIDSIRNALPFHFQSVQPDQNNQIIECATRRFYNNLRPPQSMHPFLPLHEAIFNLSHQACPRCASLTHVEMLRKNVGVCPPCYSAIYLTNPPVKQIIRRDSDLSFLLSENQANKNANELPLEEDEQVVQVQNIIKSVNAINPSDQPQHVKKSSSKSGDVFQVTKGSNYDSNEQTDNNTTREGRANDDGDDIASQAVGWKVNSSDRAQRTINPIRNLVQNIKVNPNPDKEVIKLSVGDPTVYGNLKVNETIIDIYADILRNSSMVHGYSHSTGLVHARQAVADRYSRGLEKPLTSDDVILTCGTSGAIELVFGVLANEGDNILLPQPGFPLFRTLANNLGIECQYYRLRPHDNWKVELSDMKQLINDRTKAIVVNNPSNPCGSVFERTHIEEICAIAEKFRIPIISDEVYADMTFKSDDAVPYVSFGQASTHVPVFCVGGISKQFVVPGWRLGWILIHDRYNIFADAGVYKGLLQLTTRMLVPNTPAQMIVPNLLNDNHQETFKLVMDTLEINAKFMFERLSQVDGLKCIQPQGAMYMMVLVDVKNMGLKDDMHFVEELYKEEAVFVLPGQCFQAPNFFRIVFSAPQHILSDACSRIEAFCQRRVAQKYDKD